MPDAETLSERPPRPRESLVLRTLTQESVQTGVPLLQLLHHEHETATQIRIELSLTQHGYLSQRRIYRHRLPVAAPMCHRIERIRNRDNARHQRNRPPRQAIGI